MAKLRVGVLFGGRSGEHEVSLLSAASVLDAIPKDKYEVVLIGITKQGQWLTAAHAERLLRGEKALGGGPVSGPPRRVLRSPESKETHLRAGDPGKTATAAVLAKGESVIFPPAPSHDDSPHLVPLESESAGGSAAPRAIELDVIFPVLHGTFGEDGTIQGLLELADVPYVGAGVLGSACGMDKDVMKRLFAQAGLAIVKHLTILRAEWARDPKGVTRRIEQAMTYPLFVKPANLGSSVGISKVHKRGELRDAMELAAGFDRKIIVEQGVGGRKRGGAGKAREIECSVLGNDEPQASVASEVVPATEFYDYAAKYLDEGSQLLIPAKLSKRQMQQVQAMAIAAFQAVDCAGLARVDFLMDPVSGKLYVNEINTMPGFTAISMYPKLWAASGLPYSKLIDRLIQLALERHAERKKNQYSR